MKKCSSLYLLCGIFLWLCGACSHGRTWIFQTDYLLMNPAYDWTLEELEESHSWMLYRLESGDKRESYLLRAAAGGSH